MLKKSIEAGVCYNNNGLCDDGRCYCGEFTQEEMQNSWEERAKRLLGVEPDQIHALQASIRLQEAQRQASQGI
jgi:hypothetical protein